MTQTSPERSTSTATASVSIDTFAQKGGADFYEWFNRARVVLMFALGCGLIIYSVVDNATNLAYIIVGAVLIGLVPVDQWLQAAMYRRNGGRFARDRGDEDRSDPQP